MDSAIALRDPIDWHRVGGVQTSVAFLRVNEHRFTIQRVPRDAEKHIPTLTWLPSEMSISQLPAAYRLLSTHAVQSVLNSRLWVNLNPYFIPTVEELSDWLACVPPHHEKHEVLIALAQGVLKVFGDSGKSEEEISSVAKLASAQFGSEERSLLYDVLEALAPDPSIPDQAVRLIRGQALALRKAPRINEELLLNGINETSTSIDELFSQIQPAPESQLWNKLLALLDLYGAYLDRVVSNPTFWVREGEKKRLIETLETLRLESGKGDKLSDVKDRLLHSQRIHRNDRMLYSVNYVREALTRLPDDTDPGHAAVATAQKTWGALKASWGLVRSVATLDADAVTEKGSELKELLQKDKSAHRWYDLVQLLSQVVQKEDCFSDFLTLFNEVITGYNLKIFRKAPKEAYANFLYQAVTQLEELYFRGDHPETLGLLLEIYRDQTRKVLPGEERKCGNHDRVRRRVQEALQHILLGSDLSFPDLKEVWKAFWYTDPVITNLQTQLTGWLDGKLPNDPLALLRSWKPLNNPPKANTDDYLHGVLHAFKDAVSNLSEEVQAALPRGGQPLLIADAEHNQFRPYWVIHFLADRILDHHEKRECRRMAALLLSTMYAHPTAFGLGDQLQLLLEETQQEVWAANRGSVRDILGAAIECKTPGLIAWIEKMREPDLSRLSRDLVQAPVSTDPGYWQALKSVVRKLVASEEVDLLRQLLGIGRTHWPESRLTRALARDAPPEDTLITVGRRSAFALIGAALAHWHQSKGHELAHYIPGRASPSRKGEGTDLIVGVEEFLASSAKVLLLQGDSGSGKTSALLYLSYELLRKQSDAIPVYVRLVRYRDLKSHLASLCPDRALPYIFLLDGVDEIGAHTNLYYDHSLSEFANAKFVYTCRTQHLPPGYESNFRLMDNLDKPDFTSFSELYLSAFSSEEQERYIENTTANSREFIDKLSKFPRLQEMAARPFVLSILVEIFPDFDDRATRSDIYEAFVRKRLEQEMERRNDADLVEDLYSEACDLGYDLFVKHKLQLQLPPSGHYRDAAGKELYKKLLMSARRGWMLCGAGDGSYEFLHPSLRDYFAAVKLFASIDNPQVFAAANIRDERQILEFMVYKLWSNPNRAAVEAKLFKLIQEKRSLASSNAATLLAAAGVSFSGENLEKAYLFEADLSGAVMHYTDLRNADLSNTRLVGAQIVNAKLQGANLTDAIFGEFPFIKTAEAIECIAHHPTRTECALGIDNRIEIWCTDTPRLICTFEGHTKTVKSVSFNPNGGYLLSGSNDNTIRQWDLKMGSLSIHSPAFQKHADNVTSVCYSPNGEHILSGSEDGILRQWDAHNGDAPKLFIGHTSGITSVCYGPKGERALSGSKDMTLHLWNVKSEDPVIIHVFQNGTSWVHSVCFSPDGKRALSGSECGVVQEWNVVVGGSPTYTFKGHTQGVRSVCYSPKGRYALSGSLDGTVRQWDTVERGFATQIFQGHREGVRSVCYSHDGSRVLSGSWDKTVRQWDALRGGSVSSIGEGHSDWVISVCFSSNGNHILSAGWDKIVRQWNVDRRGSDISVFRGNISSITCVCFSPDNQHVLSGSWDKIVRLWNVNNKNDSPEIFEGHSDWVTSVRYSPDGNYILSGSKDKTVRQWDVNNKDALPKIFEGHNDGVTSVCYSPNGNHILSGSKDKTVRQWDVNNKDALPKIFEGHSDWVTSVCYSPNENHILSGSKDKTVRQWNVNEIDALPEILEGHSDWVTSVCYSPDGNHILSGSKDGTARIWCIPNSTSRHILHGHSHILRGHTAEVEGVDWANTGFIVTASKDSTVALWSFVDKKWGMVWRSGITSLAAWGCKIDFFTKISQSNRSTLIQHGEMDFWSTVVTAIRNLVQ